MAFEINPLDYCTAEEIREAILDGCKAGAANYLISKFFKNPSEELNRLVGNAALTGIRAQIDKQFNTDFEKLIQKRILNELTKGDWCKSYWIFREKDSFNSESPAQKVVNETIETNKEVIRDKVKQTIENYNYEKKIAEEVSNIFGKLSDIFYSKSINAE